MTSEADPSDTFDDVSDDDDFGHVIVSLGVFVTSALPELAAFERSDRAADGEWRYDLGTIAFDESNAAVRAVALERAISTLLDTLSVVSSETLFEKSSFVRLFITFGRGAQTLSAGIVQRISAVNATIWIDA